MVSDTARVDHHDVRHVVNVDSSITGLRQLFGQGGRFAEIQLAPKGVEGCFETRRHGRKGTLGPEMQPSRGRAC